MMNKLKSSLSFDLKTCFKQFYMSSLFMLTTRSRKLFTTCNFDTYVLMINKLKISQLNYLLKNIYSSLKSPEEPSKLSVICLITFFLSGCINILLKTLSLVLIFFEILIFFKSRIQADYC